MSSRSNHLPPHHLPPRLGNCSPVAVKPPFRKLKRQEGSPWAAIRPGAERVGQGCPSPPTAGVPKPTPFGTRSSQERSRSVTAPLGSGGPVRFWAHPNGFYSEIAAQSREAVRLCTIIPGPHPQVGPVTDRWRLRLASADRSRLVGTDLRERRLPGYID